MSRGFSGARCFLQVLQSLHGVTKRSLIQLLMVPVVIITDGLENHSREQPRSSIFEMIEQRRKDGWVFVFLGANQDVYAEGEYVAVAPANRAAGRHPRRLGGDVGRRFLLDLRPPGQASGGPPGRSRHLLSETAATGTTRQVVARFPSQLLRMVAAGYARG